MRRRSKALEHVHPVFFAQLLKIPPHTWRFKVAFQKLDGMRQGVGKEGFIDKVHGRCGALNIQKQTCHRLVESCGQQSGYQSKLSPSAARRTRVQGKQADSCD